MHINMQKIPGLRLFTRHNGSLHEAFHLVPQHQIREQQKLRCSVQIMRYKIPKVLEHAPGGIKGKFESFP